ncbi:hypothetical protein M758_3G077100 [Ceratodon purpureus]|nr:hypothetical protein M758_3G077100 [Ceratodon purpureus]
MADHLSLVMDCIQYVQDKVQGGDAASTIQLNRSQCEYVAQELLKLSQSLHCRGVHEFDRGIARTALLHLHAAVKRAHMLVERCCCENSSWLAVAIMMGDTQEEVISILLDLHQWKFVLDIAICASVGGSRNAQLQIWESGEEGYQRLLKKHSKMQNAIRDASRQDQKELLERIASSGGKGDQCSDDHIRRVYLKSWLNPAEGEMQSVENQLNAWTFSRALGKGASGMVLQVKWLGQELALKKLEVIDRTEATVLGRLQHPRIVRLFHYWEEHGERDDPHSCIIMELMPTDLQKHIRNVLRRQSGLVVPSKKRVIPSTPFSLPVAIDTMLQVAQAMWELHEKKLTHRDLKTSNILVKPVSEGYLELHSEGYLEVKLADFGSAKAYANTSQTGDLTRNTGTTVYGAPEIFEKEKKLRERSFPPKADVWSFGMTCSEILTGEVPFDAESRPTLHTRIIKNGLRPSLPEACPEYLQFCIRSCWELQPQKRPSFYDMCRMLRHAKLLSLGLLDAMDIEPVFAYQSSSAYVLKSGVHSLHLQEGAKMTSRFGVGTIWRNLRAKEGSSRSEEPSTSLVESSVKSWWPPSLDLVDDVVLPAGRLLGDVLTLGITARNRRIRRYLQIEFKREFKEFDVKPIIFPYNELRVATRDFHPEMKLGEGGYGAVYKGILPNEHLVAVKLLYTKISQGLDEFLNEIALIAGMKHRNLVRLEGCSFRDNQRILVYEYVDNYDVDRILLGRTRQFVSWPARVKICLGIARGLHYLHALADPKIIHRDIKASNVLLDVSLEPKIGDFGLARLSPDEEGDIITMNVAGTKGYIAPEYATLGQLSDKVDVYSFGVLCLEIISGRRNIDETAHPGQVYLRNYAWHLHAEDRLMELVDATLDLTDEEMQRDAQRLIKVGLLCTQNDPERRPTMARIVDVLDNEDDNFAGFELEDFEGEDESFGDKVALTVDKVLQIPETTGMTEIISGRRKTF